MNLKILILFFFFLSWSARLVSQSYSPEALADDLEHYNSVLKPEKVYVHTDKDVYTPGDTVWFKVFLLDAVEHRPVCYSSLVYVELFDQFDELISRKKIYNQAGTDSGEFALLNDPELSYYTIRAYTSHMRNWDPDLFFTKSLRVWNPLQESGIDSDADERTQKAKITSGSDIKPELRMFPEGGSSVIGLNSRIAVELKSMSGEPINTTLQLVDNSGRVVSSFKTYDRGIGVFNLTANRDKDYKLVLEHEGISYSYDIADGLDNGYVLSVNERKGKLMIETSHNFTLKKFPFLIIHSRGKFIWSGELSFDENGRSLIVLDSDELQEGVLTVSLFSELGEPIAERLSFIRHNSDPDKINLDIESTVSSKDMTLTLDVKSSTELSEIYDCVLSIYNAEDERLSVSEQNIYTYLLLNSDLRGLIQDPWYFFEEDSYQKRFLLDLTMMVHGWSRFNWNEISDSKKLEAMRYPYEKGIMISGYTSGVFNLNKGKETRVLLNIMDGDLYEEEKLTTEYGDFSFGPFTSFDTLDAFVQARKINTRKNQEGLDGNRNVVVHLDEESFPYFLAPYIEIDSSGSKTEDVEETFVSEFRDMKYEHVVYEDMMTVELDEFVISAKKMTQNDSLNEMRRRFGGYGSYSERVIFENEDVLGVRSVFDVLRRVAGIRVEGSPPTQTATIRGVGSLNADLTPLYIFNGSRVSEEFVNSIDPSQVVFVDVVKDGAAAIYGLNGSNGAILIYADTNLPRTYQRKPGIIDFRINGFYNGKEFYSPEFSSELNTYGLPDIRSTLYWNPDVQLKDGERISINFVNSDLKGDHKVVLEGMSANGDIIYKEFEFRVN